MDISSSDISEDKSKGKVVFKVRKGDFYDDLLKEEKTINETENESDSSYEVKGSDEHSSSNRISAFSKVNFSKLNPEEKDLRLKNLAKIVKHLRKKIRNNDRPHSSFHSSLFFFFIFSLSSPGSSIAGPFPLCSFL